MNNASNIQIVPLVNFGKQFEKKLLEAGTAFEVRHRNLPGLGWVDIFTQRTNEGMFTTVTHRCEGEAETVRYISGWVEDEDDDILNPPAERITLEINLDLRGDHMEWMHDPSCSKGVINPSYYGLLSELDRLYSGSISEANWEIRQILSWVREPLDITQFYSVTFKNNVRRGSCVWDHPMKGWAILERFPED